MLKIERILCLLQYLRYRISFYDISRSCLRLKYWRPDNYILHHFKFICLRCNNRLVTSSIFLPFYDVSPWYHGVYWRRGIDTNCLIPVSDTPSFAITRLPGFGIPIVEGMSVSLKCEVDSNPASTPIWQRGKWRAKKKKKRKWNSRTAFRLISQLGPEERLIY